MKYKNKRKRLLIYASSKTSWLRGSFRPGSAQSSTTAFQRKLGTGPNRFLPVPTGFCTDFFRSKTVFQARQLIWRTLISTNFPICWFCFCSFLFFNFLRASCLVLINCLANYWMPFSCLWTLELIKVQRWVYKKTFSSSRHNFFFASEIYVLMFSWTLFSIGRNFAVILSSNPRKKIPFYFLNRILFHNLKRKQLTYRQARDDCTEK